MTDERYLFVSDVKEKKNIARSAHNRRTHTGKGGKVMMPSDYLTRKEKAAMNGEVKTYKLNEPMTWKEFKEMPDNLKVDYITLLRNKFDVPDARIAEMFGIAPATLSPHVNRLCVEFGLAPSSAKRSKWDKDGFDKWRFGVKTEKIEEDENVIKQRYDEEPVDLMSYEELAKAIDSVPSASRADCEKTHSIPDSGCMEFNCPADEALGVICTILGNKRVKLFVTWQVSE